MKSLLLCILVFLFLVSYAQASCNFNGDCEVGESVLDCSYDCNPVECGNYGCQSSQGEDCSTCPLDCGQCTCVTDSDCGQMLPHCVHGICFDELYISGDGYCDFVFGESTDNSLDCQREIGDPCIDNRECATENFSNPAGNFSSLPR